MTTTFPGQEWSFGLEPEPGRVGVCHHKFRQTRTFRQLSPDNIADIDLTIGCELRVKGKPIKCRCIGVFCFYVADNRFFGRIIAIFKRNEFPGHLAYHQKLRARHRFDQYRAIKYEFWISGFNPIRQRRFGTSSHPGSCPASRLGCGRKRGCEHCHA